VTRCDRFERERLADLLDDAAPAADGAAEDARTHVEGCDDCRAARARYQRIARAIAELGTGAQRRSDHVARVLASADGGPAQVAAIHPFQRLRRLAPVVAPLAIAAAVLLVWWLRRGPEPVAPQLAIEIVARGESTLRSGARPGSDARLGDRLRVTARAPAAIWIYRNDRELLRVCPRDCGRDGERLVTEVDLDAIGRYQIVWLSTDQVPLPVGDVERDVAAGRAAGAVHELHELDVR
jgi:hypothetical protein